MPTVEETIKQQFARTLTGKDWHLFKHMAVLPTPQSIRALALYILFKERPDLITDSHRTEFAQLMEPVFKAEQDGQMEEWYQRTNPETWT